LHLGKVRGDELNAPFESNQNEWMQHSTVAQWVEVAKKVFQVGASKHADNLETRSA